MSPQKTKTQEQLLQVDTSSTFYSLQLAFPVVRQTNENVKCNMQLLCKDSLLT